MDQEDDVDERELVDRARLDPDAFSELYRRHVDRIHRFAHRRTGSREEAEDVTAATFEKALRGLPRYQWKPGGFAPWLYRIAANEVTDRHRARGRVDTERAQRALGRYVDHPVVADVDRVEDADDVAALLRALDELKPRHQKVIALSYLTGLDADQVAEALGRSRATVAVALHRALEALRKQVGAT